MPLSTWITLRAIALVLGSSGTGDRNFINALPRIFKAGLPAIALTLAACGGVTQEDVSARSQLSILESLAPVDQPVETWLPLSLALIQDGRSAPKTWVTGRGRPPKSAVDRPMRVASISKLAVAFAAMHLVEDGALDLDKDVSDYLGWPLKHPDFPDAAITARMLLSHTAGLYDGTDYNADLPTTMQELMADERFYLSGGHEPGAYFTYSNIGYGVLGALIEAVSGERFDRYVERILFEPAGLDVGFNWHGVSLSRQAQALPLGRYGFAAGKEPNSDALSPETLEAQSPQETTTGQTIFIAVDGEPVGPSPTRRALEGYKPGTNGTLFSPQGGMRASLTDLAAIGQIFWTKGKINGARILKESTINQMLKAQWSLNKAGDNGDTYGGLMTSYGLGVHLLEPKPECFKTRRKRYVGHFGEAYGLLGGLLVDPKSDRTVAYLFPYTPDTAKDYIDECSGMYKWEEAFLRQALAP